MVPAPLAVICAMESELGHLRAALDPGREERQAGRCAWLTALQGYPIVLSCCGIGMLSAAAVTEPLLGAMVPPPCSTMAAPARIAPT